MMRFGLVVTTTTLALLSSSSMVDARLNGQQDESSEIPSHRQNRRELQPLRLTAQQEIDFLLNPTVVSIPGDNGFPVYAYPLGLCEGDCDDDLDCRDGFICAQRRSNQPLVGCLFSPDPASNATIEDSNDLCIPPPVARARIEFGGNDGEPASAFPLKICQADCDDDSDCADGLVCLEREEEGDAVSIYCEGAPFNDEDYCVPPPGVVPPIDGVTDSIPEVLQYSISGFPVFEGEELDDLNESIFIGNYSGEALITVDGHLNLTTPSLPDSIISTSINKRGLNAGEEMDDMEETTIDTINDLD